MSKSGGTERMYNKCAACGKFLSWDSAVSTFVPDSEYTIEKVEWFHPECLTNEERPDIV